MAVVTLIDIKYLFKKHKRLSNNQLLPLHVRGGKFNPSIGLFVALPARYLPLRQIVLDAENNNSPC